MNLKLVSVLSIVGLMVACGDSGSSTSSGGSDSGGNGGGGNGGEGTGATTNGPGPVGPGPGSGGAQGTECEDADADPGDIGAEPGTPEADTCDSCQECAFAQGGPCQDFLDDFLAQPGCAPATMGATDNWVVCVFGDFEEPQVVTGCNSLPEAEFEGCLAMCGMTYPMCEDLYLTFFSCGICGQCPVSCDGVDTAGDGPNCVPADG